MSAFEILMILKLDDLQSAFSALFVMCCVAAIPLSALTLGFYSIAELDDKKDEDTVKYFKFLGWLKMAIILGFAYLVLLVVIPSTKQAITMMAGAEILNNRKVIELTPKVLDVVSLEVDKKLKLLKKENENER